MRRILSKRQFRCEVILSALFALLSSLAFARPGTMDELVRPPLLVDINWLQERRGASGLVIVDARSPEEYRRGHITGAINQPSIASFNVMLR